MRNGANCLDSSAGHSYTSVQRVAGGCAPAQPADGKEIRDEEKGQERRHEKRRKEKVAAGHQDYKEGASQFPGRPFLLGEGLYCDSWLARFSSCAGQIGWCAQLFHW